jgi:hypothetical protein
MSLIWIAEGKDNYYLVKVDNHREKGIWEKANKLAKHWRLIEISKEKNDTLDSYTIYYIKINNQLILGDL